MRKLINIVLIPLLIMVTLSLGIQKLGEPFEHKTFDTTTSTKNISSAFKDFFNSFSELIPDSSDSKSTASDEIVGCYKVSYVIDGDTFLIEKDGERVKVRLIGVDTPESVASDEYLAKTGKENTAEGKQASEFTNEILSGKSVYLEYDESETDKYGRTLAYVYLDADKTQMLQEILLENGMARCMEIAPNTRYASHFKKLEQVAKDNNVGFWAMDVWQED